MIKLIYFITLKPEFCINPKPPSTCDTFSKPISLSVFAAKADLPPAAQKSTISLFRSIFLFWTCALSGCIENSNKPLEIFSEFSILPVF